MFFQIARLLQLEDESEARQIIRGDAKAAMAIHGLFYGVPHTEKGNILHEIVLSLGQKMEKNAL